MPSALFFAATVPITASAGAPPGAADDELYLLSEDATFSVLTEDGAFYITFETGGGPPPADTILAPWSKGLVDEDIMVTVHVSVDSGAPPALRLSNRGPIIQESGGASYQFEPRLFMPLQFGARISSEQYGEPVRGLPNAGAIDFAIDESIWPVLGYSWPGRVFFVARGNVNNQIYKGRVDTLTYQAGRNPRASIKTTSAALDFDKPLPRDLYPDDFPIEALRGRPRPWMRGVCFGIEPVLEDTALQMYRISWGIHLDAIYEVRVGGIVWEEVLIYPPGPGQWYASLAGGVFYLGSTTDGGEVRCDAVSNNSDTFWHSAGLLNLVVNLAGGVCDTDSLEQFRNDAPWPIGYYIGPEQVNCLTILDEIVAGVGGYWSAGQLEAVRCGVIKAPPDTSDCQISDIDIEECRLIQTIPPAWRMRIEYRRNWNPATQFFTAVEPDARQAQSAPGKIAPSYENLEIRNYERRAVDVPVIRSLMLAESHAIQVRDRLVEAWGVRRQIYEVQTQLVAMPELYTSVGIDFEMVSGNYLIHSAVWSIGGGASVLQLWG